MSCNVLSFRLSRKEFIALSSDLLSLQAASKGQLGEVSLWQEARPRLSSVALTMSPTPTVAVSGLIRRPPRRPRTVSTYPSLLSLFTTLIRWFRETFMASDSSFKVTRRSTRLRYIKLRKE
jgi:hypothetical protein